MPKIYISNFILLKLSLTTTRTNISFWDEDFRSQNGYAKLIYNLTQCKTLKHDKFDQ